MTATLFLAILTASGVFTILAETIRHALARRIRQQKLRVYETSNAQKVQDMALDLVKPLHEELRRANKQVVTLNEAVERVTSDAEELAAKLETTRVDLQDVAVWALAAKALLDRHQIDYPTPIPEVLWRQHNGGVEQDEQLRSG